ncbi:MAG TPA: hypothetical protein VEG44_02280 [Candidatus Acidoferrales bacterium]|nr:hypothetical protein [Candidatus Acidoferrales bacterium]
MGRITSSLHTTLQFGWHSLPKAIWIETKAINYRSLTSPLF